MKVSKKKWKWTRAARTALAALMVSALALAGCTGGDDDDDDETTEQGGGGSGTSDPAGSGGSGSGGSSGVSYDDSAYKIKLFSQDYSEAGEAGWTPYVNGFVASDTATDEKGRGEKGRGTVTLTGGYVNGSSTNGVFFAPGNATTNNLYAVESGTDFKVTFDIRPATAGGKEHALVVSNAVGFGLNTSSNPQGCVKRDANCLFYLDQTEKAGETWKVNGSDVTVTLAPGSWYTVTLVVDGDATYYKVTPQGQSSSSWQKLDTVGGGLGLLAYATNGAATDFGFDNFAVYGKTDLLSATVALGGGAESAVIDSSSTLTLDASASFAVAGAADDAEFAWSVPQGTTAVTLSGTGSSVTVTNANSTLTDAKVVVSVKASAGGAEAEASYTVTAKADASLLADPSVTAKADEAAASVTANDSENTFAVSATAGQSLRLTAKGAVAEAYTATEAEAFAYAWAAASDNKAVSVADGAAEAVATLKLASVEAETTETVTLTVKAGSVSKTYTVNVTVKPSAAAVSAVKVFNGTTEVTDALALVLGLADVTLSATAEPDGVAGVTFEWSLATNDYVTLTANDDGTATLHARALTENAQTLTLAVKQNGGSTSVGATVSVTVAEPTYVVKHKQDFESSAITVGKGRINNRFKEQEGLVDGSTLLTTDQANTTLEVAVDNGNHYAHWEFVGSTLSSPKNADRWFNTMEDLEIPTTAGTKYKLSFEACIIPGSSNNPSYFTIIDEEGHNNTDATHCLLSEGYDSTVPNMLSHSTLYFANSENRGNTWTLYSDGKTTRTTFTLDEVNFFKFTIAGTVGSSDATLTVEKVADSSTVLVATTYKMTSTTGIPRYLHYHAAKAFYSGGIKLDNIIVSIAE